MMHKRAGDPAIVVFRQGPRSGRTEQTGDGIRTRQMIRH